MVNNRADCDPCCNPEEVVRNIEAFKWAVLQTLCDIASNTSGGGGVGANVNIAAYGGVATTLGQKVMASSIPVVIASNQSALAVTGSFDPGTPANWGIFAEDSAASSGQLGQSILLVRQDTLASSTSTDGDYGNLKSDALGELYTVVNSTVAAATADSGNPIKIGGKYNVVSPTLAAGQRGDLQLDVASNAKFYLASLLFGENSTVVTSGSNTGTLGVTQNPAYSLQYSPLTDLQSGVISRTTASTANKNLLVSYSVQNTSATMLYFQVWNGASVGAGTLVDFVPVPAGTTNSPGSSSKGTDDFGSNGIFCASGISWGWSTTATTYTAVGAGTGLTTQVVYFTA